MPLVDFLLGAIRCVVHRVEVIRMNPYPDTILAKVERPTPSGGVDDPLTPFRLNSMAHGQHRPPPPLSQGELPNVAFTCV